MTINEMIKEMENNLREISMIRRELKFKKSDRYEVLKRVMSHTDEWAVYLTQRVITNYRKPQIEGWYKQSKVALKRAKRVLEG